MWIKTAVSKSNKISQNNNTDFCTTIKLLFKLNMLYFMIILKAQLGLTAFHGEIIPSVTIQCTYLGS